MTVMEFEQADPFALEGALRALWWAGRGDWERAHELAQETESANGSWVHAYLHRAEGDAFNAAFWYRKAGRPVAAGDPRQEWEAMVAAMLADKADGAQRR